MTCQAGSASLACRLAARGSWRAQGRGWSMSSGVPTDNSMHGEVSGPVESIALSPDESLVACGTVNGGVSLFHPTTGETLVEIPAHRRL